MFFGHPKIVNGLSETVVFPERLDLNAGEMNSHYIKGVANNRQARTKMAIYRQTHADI